MNPFRAEPPYVHGAPEHTAVLLVNLGTPDAPTAPALRRYLAEFLGDQRVVEIPAALWKPILHGIILRTRPRRSAMKYASIWMPEGSPLKVWTQRATSALESRLSSQGVLVEYAMRYGNPGLPAALDSLKARGVTRLLVVPLYPQYCAATTATVNDGVARWLQGVRRQPAVRFAGDFHDDAGYIGALASRLRRHWNKHPPGERLVLSFHGMPARTLQLGDPYHCQCLRTARLLAEALALPSERVVVTFQSRFGRAQWLQPYTEPRLVDLAKKGIRSVDVMCPGFVADCVETLEEIAQEAREAFIQAGGQAFRYVPCLNDEPEWIEALQSLVHRHLSGWPLSDPRPSSELEASAERARALGAPS